MTLRDQNGDIIPGFDGVRVASNATLSLASLTARVTAITATVTLEGITAPASIPSAQVEISWNGDPVQMCFRTTAPPVACDAAAPVTLSNTAKAVTTSTGGSDAPGGNATGAVQFLVRADSSQCSLAITKTSGVQTAHPGGKVDYTITVKNTGSQAYEKAAFTDDLTDVLEEATFDGSPTASLGTVTYVPPLLSWTGALAPAATATISYSVTVKNPDPGDRELLNTVVSTSPGANCAPQSKDPLCTVTIPVTVSELLWHKVDAGPAANLLDGSAWTLTPVDAKGTPIGPAIAVTDCAADAAAVCADADLDPLGGVFRVTGLGPGTYRLAETQAPPGFRLATAPIPVTIADGATTVPLADIPNTQVPVPALPFTGGLGSDALTLGGSGLLGAALVVLVIRVLHRRRATA